MEKRKFLLWKEVNISGGVLGEKQRVNEKVTIPYLFQSYEETGRFDFLKNGWNIHKKYEPHHFWDSDIAKLIEAAAYTLITNPSKETEERLDNLIEAFEKKQQSDGYLNTYFSNFCIEYRFTDLMMMHELYCAGHLIEAAVAYYEASGKRTLLNIICRYLECINTHIGKENGKIHGYDGHPEIELALMRLYHVTSEKKYYQMASYYIEERGTKPYFFEEEAYAEKIDITKPHREIYDIGSFYVQNKKNTDNINPMMIPKVRQERVYKWYLPSKGAFAQFSANAPVRELKEPAGHAVRAMYLYCAMTDLAEDDETLLETCRRLWRELVDKQMYITGGIGQSQECERFSYAYDLPNEGNYCETCASIGLFMWAKRMLCLELKSEYADVMERTLYNGIMSGCSSDGKAFFYSNHMSMYPRQYTEGSYVIQSEDRISPIRRKTFSISCCPANYARLIASIGGYFYSADDDNLYIHLYNESSIEYCFSGIKTKIEQITDYPREETITILINPEETVKFGIYLRIPGWCRQWSCLINNEKQKLKSKNGYICIQREWKQGDKILLITRMEPVLYAANPKVRQNSGKIAVMRGPIVYCMEEADNFTELSDFVIRSSEKIMVESTKTFEGFPVLRMKGRKTDISEWGNKLYQDIHEKKQIDVIGTAIPYYMWANRGLGEMLVWMNAE